MLTLLTTVLAGVNIGGAVTAHVTLLVAVFANHGLGTVANLVLTLTAGAHEGFGTLVDVVTLLATVTAALRTGVRALLGEVTLLLALVALTRARLGRLGAVGLVVTGSLLLVEFAAELRNFRGAWEGKG